MANTSNAVADGGRHGSPLYDGLSEPAAGRVTRVHDGEQALQAIERAESLWSALDVPLTARGVWLRAYLDAFPGQRPVVVDVCHGARTVAVACFGRSVGAVVEWTALGIGVSDYAALAAEDEDAARRLAVGIVEVVHVGRRPWRLRLEQLPPDNPVLGHLGSMLPHVSVRPGIPATRLTLTDPRTLANHVSRNGRRSLNKGWNRLRHDGHDVTVRRLRTGTEVAAALDDIVATRRARDHQVGRRSDVDDLRFERFYRRVLPELADRDQLEIIALYVRDVLVSYTLGFLDGADYRVWDGRVAVGWTSYSAGRLCDSLALTSAMDDQRFATFDWMRGDQDYKQQAATHVVQHEHLHAWSSAGVRRGFRLAVAIARRARLLTEPGALRRLAAWCAPRRRSRRQGVAGSP